MFERYLSLVALVKMILKQNTKDDWKLLDYKLSALRRPNPVYQRLSKTGELHWFIVHSCTDPRKILVFNFLLHCNSSWLCKDLQGNQTNNGDQIQWYKQLKHVFPHKMEIVWPPYCQMQLKCSWNTGCQKRHTSVLLVGAAWLSGQLCENSYLATLFFMFDDKKRLHNLSPVPIQLVFTELRCRLQVPSIGRRRGAKPWLGAPLTQPTWAHGSQQEGCL